MARSSRRRLKNLHREGRFAGASGKPIHTVPKSYSVADRDQWKSGWIEGNRRFMEAWDRPMVKCLSKEEATSEVSGFTIGYSGQSIQNIPQVYAGSATREAWERGWAEGVARRQIMALSPVINRSLYPKPTMRREGKYDNPGFYDPPRWSPIIYVGRIESDPRRH